MSNSFGPLDPLDSIFLIENSTLQEIDLLRKQLEQLEKGVTSTKNEIAKREERYETIVRGVLKRRGLDVPVGKRPKVRRNPNDPNTAFVDFA